MIPSILSPLAADLDPYAQGRSGGAAADSLPPSKDDHFVVLQFTSPAVVGSAAGNDTYLLSPSLLPAGLSFTVSDTQGSNGIQLAPGLRIASSRVAASALQLTLDNGSVITVLGAQAFSFDPGANSSAGLDAADLSFGSFAQQVLGVEVPTGGGFNTGGAVLIGAAALPALGGEAVGDDFVVAQFASPAILGAGAGNDTYLLSAPLLPAGMQLTISDTQGSNGIQLAPGLSIASSRVAATALQLTLVNGSVITVLGAPQFGYEPGGNRSAGIDGPDLSFADFALQVLGVAVPSSGFNEGGAVLIGGAAGGGNITVPVGSTAPLAATAGADVFNFDVNAARSTVANTQVQVSGFDPTADRLRFDMTLASGSGTLAGLNGQQGLVVQVDPFTPATVLTFGPDADGNVITLSLIGVTDPAQIQVDIV